MIWSGKRDSNPQPTAWKAVALAIELFPHSILVARAGFEPAKAVPTDLQSVPFSHSGTSPTKKAILHSLRQIMISFFYSYFNLFFTYFYNFRNTTIIINIIKMNKTSFLLQQRLYYFGPLNNYPCIRIAQIFLESHK